MKKQGSLLVGFDLCNEYSQISCYNNGVFETETVYYNYGSEDELIPTVLALRKDCDEWFFANEAIEESRKGKAVLVKNIVTSVAKKEPIKIMDVEYDEVDLLSLYFRKSLSLLKMYYPSESILKLVVTIEDTDKVLVDGIFKALEKLGLGKDRVSVQGHSRSYMYYALSQKKDLWMNDVSLFDFDEVGLKYYQITMDRKQRPITVGVSYKSFVDTLSYDLFEDMSEEHIQYIFENIATSVVKKQNISTIYLTGKGFVGEWVEPTIKNFCVGKRVFKGQNLFSEGALYTARELSGDTRFSDYLFMSEDMVVCSVSANVYFDAKERELLFVKTATPWYEAEKAYELILNDTSEIEIVIRNELKKTKLSYIMPVDLFEDRPNRTTRVRVKAKFLNTKVCAITVKDLGFGEFYPATNRVWEKIINMDQV